MSATETQPDSSYFLRKLHSFTGLLPVGAFLAEHFWSNSAALVSSKKYDNVSQDRGVGRDFSADAFSRRLRRLHLVAGQGQRLRVPLGGELALQRATLHGTDRFCLHWVAPLHRTLVD